ncbi:alpha/beta fold hydrolase [Caviibacterium pharyngocola]|uniref:Alpha/beta hydrolase n=1 Tax=Caviibacterium pharyngocola TaxID=28159 RepID=A0A2M8RTN1_9PAST|nr:alpha/beta fold hydrolase [Caviibacterium pharyngocola]PJG82235.1 alpha/beta hydrolase [Caviibacterium pharyngocola]
MSHRNLLNFQFHQLKQDSSRPVLVFLHGLFGDMNNLGVIARAFAEDYSILRIDLRNHGQSFHCDEMNYALMAQDVLDLLDHLQLRKVILIGHSMGGKTAMCAAALRPELVEKLVVIDIAPVNYGNHGHDSVFAGLFAVKHAAPQTRQQAKPILAAHISQESVQQFMLKSFDQHAAEYFRFNLTALYRNYVHLMDWQNVYFPHPTLFIKGGDSDYILPAYTQTVLAQFPRAESFTINGSGHWVHAEKPEFVVRAIKRFLS